MTKAPWSCSKQAINKQVRRDQRHKKPPFYCALCLDHNFLPRHHWKTSWFENVTEKRIIIKGWLLDIIYYLLTFNSDIVNFEVSVELAPFWVICRNVVFKWDIFYDDENVNKWYKNIMMIVGNITSDVYLKYSHTKLYFAINSVILLLLHL